MIVSAFTFFALVAAVSSTVYVGNDEFENKEQFVSSSISRSVDSTSTTPGEVGPHSGVNPDVLAFIQGYHPAHSVESADGPIIDDEKKAKAYSVSRTTDDVPLSDNSIIGDKSTPTKNLRKKNDGVRSLQGQVSASYVIAWGYNDAIWNGLCDNVVLPAIAIGCSGGTISSYRPADPGWSCEYVSSDNGLIACGSNGNRPVDDIADIDVTCTGADLQQVFVEVDVVFGGRSSDSCLSDIYSSRTIIWQYCGFTQTPVDLSCGFPSNYFLATDPEFPFCAQDLTCDALFCNVPFSDYRTENSNLYPECLIGAGGPAPAPVPTIGASPTPFPTGIPPTLFPTNNVAPTPFPTGIPPTNNVAPTPFPTGIPPTNNVAPTPFPTGLPPTDNVVLAPTPFPTGLPPSNVAPPTGSPPVFIPPKNPLVPSSAATALVLSSTALIIAIVAMLGDMLV